VSGTPRVVLVDDHGLFRSGVRAELGRQVEVVGEADDVQPAIDLIGSVQPDVVLLDVHLPGGGGQAVVQAIKASHPSVRFLALSASDAPEDFKLWHMETPTSFNPFGMRGVGEGGTIGAHAAMANAVADALRDYDVAVDGSGPFTPTWMMEALSRPLRDTNSGK